MGKKMKKIIVTFALILLVFNFGISVEAKGGTKDQIDTSSHKVTFNVRNLKIGEEKVIFNNGDEKVSVKLDEIEPTITLFGSTGWSGGTIPDGTSTLTVKYESGGVYTASYKATVKGSTSSILDVHSPYINIVGMSNLNISYFGVERSTATNSLVARASMRYSYTFTQGGINFGTLSKYLNLELNYNGQVNILWP